MKTNTYEHLENLAASKGVVCERRGRKIELTTPCGGTTAECDSVTEALDTMRNDSTFSNLPIQIRPQAPVTKSFRVVAISSKANSFGLTGHVLIARDGAAFEVGRSRGPWNPGWDKGTDVDIPVDKNGQPDWARVSCEIPRALPVAPANIVKEIFS